MVRKGSWLASYIEEYASRTTAKDDTLFLVAYKLRDKPNRMFYYKLEQLLTAVGGRRIQKSVVIVPKASLRLVKELCISNGAEVFEAPFGSKFGGD